MPVSYTHLDVYKRQAIAPYVADTFDFMYRAVKEGKNILLEGQLGALKDTDFGIYPMVTLSLIHILMAERPITMTGP